MEQDTTTTPAAQRIRVDKRYSAICAYRWLRRCGFTKKHSYRRIVDNYGWEKS